jgi:hypothetical protein
MIYALREVGSQGPCLISAGYCFEERVELERGGAVGARLAVSAWLVDRFVVGGAFFVYQPVLAPFSAVPSSYQPVLDQFLHRLFARLVEVVREGSACLPLVPPRTLNIPCTYAYSNWHSLLPPLPPLSSTTAIF